MFKRIIKKSRTAKFIKSTRQLHHILEYERIRADRNGHEFSTVVFDAFEPKENNIFQELCDKIRIRKRIIDELGWFNSSQLCLILPYTSRNSAIKFTKEVCKKTNFVEDITYEIFTYPFNSERNPDQNQTDIYSIAQEKSEETPSKNYSFHKNLINRFGFKSRNGNATKFAHKQSQYFESLLAPSIPIWKRVIDLLFVFLVTIMFSPVFILLCVFIKIISPGPIFYQQERVGYLKKNFTLWKFRTMHLDADNTLHLNHIENLINNGKPLAKIENDKRIIPCGNILRLLCLDEFAQLLNIALGEMSVVGPRPDVLYSVQHYKQWHNRRFDTLPGLTGLWQVNGKNDTTFEKMMRLDIKYIQERSFWLECKIIAMTIPAIMKQVSTSVSKRKLKELAYTN